MQANIEIVFGMDCFRALIAYLCLALRIVLRTLILQSFGVCLNDILSIYQTGPSD